MRFRDQFLRCLSLESNECVFKEYNTQSEVVCELVRVVPDCRVDWELRSNQAVPESELRFQGEALRVFIPRSQTTLMAANPVKEHPHKCDLQITPSVANTHH